MQAGSILLCPCLDLTQRHGAREIMAGHAVGDESVDATPAGRPYLHGMAAQARKADQIPLLGVPQQLADMGARHGEAAAQLLERPAQPVAVILGGCGMMAAALIVAAWLGR